MKKNILGAVIFVLLLSLCAACGSRSPVYESEDTDDLTGILKDETEVSGEEDETVPDTVFVFVCGEVRSPGVYELQADARIEDAVEAAGGMTEDAAACYLNLADYVSDAQKIEVPSVRQACDWEQEEAERQDGRININSASEQELMTLTGIGEAKAQAIIRYREEHGGFSQPEELMEIPGIKEGVFEKIKDQIKV